MTTVARRREHSGERARRTVLTVFAWVFAFVFFIPMIWLFVSSLRPSSETFAELSPFSLGFWFPSETTPANYADALSGSFLRALLNSLLVAVATVVGGLAVSVLAGFALGVMRLPYRDAIFAVVVVSFLVPFEAVAVPLAVDIRTWGMLNTYWALILPGLGNGMAIFLLRQFFQEIPTEFREAGRVDGASWLQILVRIYLPMSKPALIAAGLILFHFQWQAYLWPLLASTTSSMDLAPVALAKFLGQYDFDYGTMFAASVLTAVLPVIFLVRLQKYFVTSLKSSGVK